MAVILFKNQQTTSWSKAALGLVLIFLQYELQSAVKATLTDLSYMIDLCPMRQKAHKLFLFSINVEYHLRAEIV